MDKQTQRELRELRCSDCAFTAGTQANASENTRLKAQLCVDGLVPFHCHLREGYCAGWGEAVNVKEASGHYDNLPEWKKKATEACLEVIALTEERDTKGEPITGSTVIADIRNVFRNYFADAKT